MGENVVCEEYMGKGKGERWEDKGESMVRFLAPSVFSLFFVLTLFCEMYTN